MPIQAARRSAGADEGISAPGCDPVAGKFTPPLCGREYSKKEPEYQTEDDLPVEFLVPGSCHGGFVHWVKEMGFLHLQVIWGDTLLP